MNNEELRKNVNFVMAHLDEVLYSDDDMFNDVVNYDVLSIVDGNLRREISSLVNTINYYKKRNDYANVSKYKEALKDVKNTLEKLNDYKKQYVERLGEIQESLRNTDVVKKKPLKDSSSKPRNNQSTDTDLYTDYSELLGFSEPVVGELFGKFLHAIRTSEFLDEYALGLQYDLPVEIEKLLKRTDTLSKKELLTLSILVKDVSKNKIRSIENDSIYATVEKEFLKKLIKLFDKLKPIIYEPVEEDTNAYYDILEKLVYNDANYTYISKLMKEIPVFVNARKNNSHFVFLLVDEFIKNYKLKLVNQGIPYINPDFYKELLILNFSLKPNLSIEEKEDFENYLTKFKDYVTLKKYKDIDKIFGDLDDIKKSIDGVIVKDDESINKQIEEKISFLSNDIKEEVNSSLRVGNDVSYAFKFQNISNYAFSVDYTEDNTIVLDIHILDTSLFIKDQDLLYEEMKKRDLPLPEFKNGNVYPTLSFTYKISSKNIISDVKVSSKLIKISSEYEEFDLDYYRSVYDLKLLFGVFKRLKQKNEIDINYYSQLGIKNFVDEILNMDISKSFKDNNMPFIYKTYLENSDDLIRINHNAVCDKLIDIPKKEAHKVFDILDQVYDEYYVPSSQNGSLELNSNKFLGLYLLTTIHRIWDGVYDINKVQEELNELLVVLNSREKYLPASVSKNNERKVKRLVRNYNKKKKKDIV